MRDFHQHPDWSPYRDEGELAVAVRIPPRRLRMAEQYRYRDVLLARQYGRRPNAHRRRRQRIDLSSARHGAQRTKGHLTVTELIGAIYALGLDPHAVTNLGWSKVGAALAAVREEPADSVHRHQKAGSGPPELSRQADYVTTHAFRGLGLLGLVEQTAAMKSAEEVTSWLHRQRHPSWPLGLASTSRMFVDREHVFGDVVDARRIPGRSRQIARRGTP